MFWVVLLLTVVPAWYVGRFFISRDPYPYEPKRDIRFAVFFGLVSIVMTLILSFLLEMQMGGSVLQLNGDGVTVKFLTSVLGFAAIEEIAKFLPLALYIYPRNSFNELSDGIIYFSLVGLTFGGLESLAYALGTPGEEITVAAVRMVLGFFFHAALTSFVGYFLASHKLYKTSWLKVLLALGAAILIHSIYNFGAFSWATYKWAIIGTAATGAGMNALMFWLYLFSSQSDKRRLAMSRNSSV